MIQQITLKKKKKFSKNLDFFLKSSIIYDEFKKYRLITYNYTKTKRGDTMELQVNQVIEELSKIDSATEQIILSAENEKEDYSSAIES